MKICLFSDFDFRSSGYFNISTALASELAQRSHEVKAIGLGYNGEEHTLPFGIIPCRDIREAFALIVNLKNMWGFDVFVCAVDIPLQEQFVQFNIQNGNPLKYVGIMPIEADPLCMSWALTLMQMDRVLVISKFGTEEAIKAGVNAKHLPVGIDTNLWRIPVTQEKESFRSALGIKPDEFTILTVAYNQERKFLSRSLEIFASFLYDMPVADIMKAVKDGETLTPKTNAKYILVTVERSMVGWKLRDLGQELGINDRLMILERGMEARKLWAIYAASDAFLLTSKAEGLGMPIMEAMSVGIPVAGTNCTGIKELLGDDRGNLIDFDYVIRDPFGNGNRYYASIESGVVALDDMYSNWKEHIQTTRMENAKKFVDQHTWQKTADVLEDVLKELIQNEEKETKPSEAVSDQSTTELVVALNALGGHSNP